MTEYCQACCSLAHASSHSLAGTLYLPGITLKKSLQTAASAVLCACASASAAPTADRERIHAITRAVEPQVLAWRRDIHEHPELSNREVRTAKLVAEHLKRIGLTPETGIAKTGVVALLKGGRAG